MDETFSPTVPEVMGECLHQHLAATYGFETKGHHVERVRRVEADLQRTRLDAARLHAEILRWDTITAFTAPGPYLYLSRGLLNRLKSDDALAFVCAHEIAHHDLGHIAVYRKNLDRLDALPGSTAMAIVLTLVERILTSPERELAADASGLELCRNMGYDSVACLETFDVLEAWALKHHDKSMVYGPQTAHNPTTDGIERWIARANTWVWERARGYPSLRERKERLLARLPTRPDGSPEPATRQPVTTIRTRSAMNLDQIDKALADWQNRLQMAMENLLALDDLLTYKRLEGKDGLPRARLSGVTQARVTPALETMHDLFEHIGALNRVVERAAELRKQVSWFRPSDSALREIEQLLMGPSIQMPSAQTPLAQRSLLSAAETTQAITPERLLAVMTQAFGAARDAVFAVDAAWSRLEPRLGDCETEMAALRQQANALGEGTCDELVTARQKIDALRGQIECDPLGASADFDSEVAPLLQRVRARLAQSAQQRNTAQANQEKARRLLAQLEETHRQCETALRECQEKVGNVAGLRAPLDSARIAELTQWLTTLETTWQAGRWQAAQVGLERWLKTAREYLNAEKAARDANNAPLEMRAELRGRLAALQAKAQARGLAGDASLSALALEANQIAQQKPLALERLSQLVAAYEQQLTARGKS